MHSNRIASRQNCTSNLNLLFAKCNVQQPSTSTAAYALGLPNPLIVMLKQCLLRPQVVAYVTNQTPLRRFSHIDRNGSTKNLLRTFSSTSNNSDAKDNKKPRLSVAVVGAGPAGFYASKYLTSSVLKRMTQSTTFAWSGIDIDLIERLPTPYGLTTIHSRM